MASSILEELRIAVIEGDTEKAEQAAKKVLEANIAPLEAITQGLAKGVKEIGDKFGNGEAFLVELILAGDVMKAGMAILLPKIKAAKSEMKSAGRIVIGTVAGDIHSIGKDIVGTLLQANGFEIINVGEDVAAETFVEKVKECQPDILGLSSLLTSTMPMQKEVIENIKAAGLRDKVKIIIGGAPTTKEWADEIGADGWAGDAAGAVNLAKHLMEGKES